MRIQKTPLHWALILGCFMTPRGTEAQTMYGIALGGLGETDSFLVDVDLATGRTTRISDSGFWSVLAGAGFRCDGTLFGFSRKVGLAKLFQVDVATGEASGYVEFSQLAFPQNWFRVGFEFTHDDRALVLVFMSLYDLDIEAGVASLVGKPILGNYGDLARAPDGSLYTEAARKLYLLDAWTGKRTLVGPTGLEWELHALAFTDDGRLYGVAGPDLVEIDPLTGQGFIVGPLDHTVQGLAFGPAQPGCLRANLLHSGISNRGILNSLMSKLDAAEASLGRQQEQSAAHQLCAMIREVDAQDGKSVDSETADDLRQAIENFAASAGLDLDC